MRRGKALFMWRVTLGLTSSSSATPAESEHNGEFSAGSHLKARKQAGQVLAAAPG